ncbi:STAS/SEC14 domain-containing protein [Psychroflexus montanilacus]|uniref:STAS/SEC14 domain-containing protein n=1 Tax=Psychroflexus montanilacus TaxID=2873598 RepID=UPI001CD02787|nr:STAS/SEC14 domain-containing protein [Psychroflexus montanilacus]MBZ9651759.1 STAS/SEC14 domain-containing protein [Psychroflexus montanilacus]
MKSNSYATVDQTAFPLINVTFTGEKSTNANFKAYLKDLEDCYFSQQKLAIVFDATQAVIPKFSHQKLQAKWLKQNTTLMKEYCLGTAYVIPSKTIQWVLKMIFLLQKQPVPYEVFSTYKEAQVWTWKQLQNED